MPWPFGSSSRSLRLLLVAVLALGAGVLGPLPTAGAVGEDVSISLVSPETGAVLSGQAAVQFRVSLSTDVALDYAYVSVSGANTQQEIPAHGCFPDCVLTLTVDTVSKTADGPATMYIGTGAREESGRGLASFPVIVDNHRPTLSIVRDRKETDSVQDHLHADLRPSARDGALIESIVWGKFPPAPGTLAPAGTADGAWALDLDTSGLAEGSRGGYLTVTDSLGRSSLPIWFGFAIVRSMHLVLPDLPLEIDDNQMLGLSLGYSYSSAAVGRQFVYPVQVVTLVDGREFSRDERPSLSFRPSPASAGSVDVSPEARVPAGRHVLSFVITDNQGLSNRIDREWVITTSAAASWLKKPPPEVVVAQRVAVSARARAKSSPIYDWSVAAVRHGDPRTFAFGGSLPCGNVCPTAEDVTQGLEFSVPGTYDLSVTFSYFDNWSTQVVATVHVVPVLTGTLDRIATVAVGNRRTLSGRVTDSDLHPVAGAVVDVQRRPAGSTSWVTLGSTTSDYTGRVHYSESVVGNADYRFWVRNRPGYWGGVAGPAAAAHATAVVRLLSRPTSIKLGGTITIRATSTPSEAGAAFSVQSFDSKTLSWRTVASSAADGHGQASIKWKPTKTTPIRVRRAATGRADSTFSQSWKVTVKR